MYWRRWLLVAVQGRQGVRHGKRASPSADCPQAVEWLKTHLQNQQATVEVTTLAHERFATTFELAVRYAPGPRGPIPRASARTNAASCGTPGRGCVGRDALERPYTAGGGVHPLPPP